MAGTSHLYIDDSRSAGGFRSSTVVTPENDGIELYFRSYDGPLASNEADPFLLASLLNFMAAGAPVHVHSRVSKRLLRNLDEVQEIWAKWRPELYSRINITADVVTEDTSRPDGPVIAAFSGGVDAAFTIARHIDSKHFEPLSAALLVHGLDIPLHEMSQFEKARARGENMLSETGIHSLGVATNIRDLNQPWGDVSGLAVAACLALYQDKYRIGLIGSSGPYDDLSIPAGSSPVTDHLYSTGAMEFVHDGAGFSRTQKVEALANWPEAVANLRVCWHGLDGSRNCGKCEKCIRTYLNFRAVGLDNVPCFDEQPTAAEIRRVITLSVGQINQLKNVEEYAASKGMGGDWVRALRFAVVKNRTAMPLYSFILKRERFYNMARRVYKKSQPTAAEKAT